MIEAQGTSDDLDIVDSMDSVTFDTDQGVVRGTYDSSRDPPCLAVIAVVATVDDSDVVDLTPLSAVVDTDALEALLSESPTGRQRSVEIAFTYEECDVTVSNHGVIEVRPLDPA